LEAAAVVKDSLVHTLVNGMDLASAPSKLEGETSATGPLKSPAGVGSAKGAADAMFVLALNACIRL